MKKIFIVFLFLSLFLFTGCEGELSLFQSTTAVDIQNSTTNSVSANVISSINNATNVTSVKTTTTKTNYVNKNIWVSPDATIGLGTVYSPTSFTDAINRIQAGYTIYLMEGIYNISNTITISNSGEEGKYKTIMPYNGNVCFDFLDSDGIGIKLDGSYWNIVGINITNAKGNGICITGNYNIIDRCSIYNNGDSGLKLTRYNENSSIEDWPQYNQIINCTSYNNFTEKDINADGFEGKILGEGNVFDGCIAFQNLNNGFDFENQSSVGEIGSVILKNCVAIYNGIDSNFEFTSNSPGNGFKLGGTGGAVSHKITNCLSAFNKGHGYTDGGNLGTITYDYCTGYLNGYNGNKKSNFHSLNTSKSRHIYKNVLSYANSTMDSDKIYGDASYSILFMSKNYYYVSEEQIVYSSTSSTRGELLESGEVTAEKLFEEYESFDYSILHANRNSNGSVNLNEFLNVKTKFEYTAIDGTCLGSTF